jgi:hypothetical protein
LESGKEYNVQELFDEIFGRHLERLTGSRHGIGALPLNLMVLSCLIMLMERDNELDGTPSSLSERYTLESLSVELEEMGFDLDNTLDETVQDMAQKGYIQIDDDRLIPQKPAISLNRLLDKIFPKMPGLNLVAYFVQTFEEVQSGRKDLNAAAGQFDQTLRMQGVSLKKDQNITSKENRKHSRYSERSQIRGLLKETRVSSSEPKILSSDQYAGKVKIQKVEFGRSIALEEESPNIIPEKEEKIDPQESEVFDQEKETATVQDSTDLTAFEDTELDGAAVHFQRQPEDPETLGQEKDRTDGFGSEEFEPISPPEIGTGAPREETVDPDAPCEKEILDGDDVDIEKRIADFEEDLSMECPMCKRAKVHVETTHKGKSYYKCTDTTCSFISWGKPHHIHCPRCSNPFLVEADKAGKPILKCPRSTCRHRQKPPWEADDRPSSNITSVSPTSPKNFANTRKPRKRVKKRRVVRRKKKH